MANGNVFTVLYLESRCNDESVTLILCKLYMLVSYYIDKQLQAAISGIANDAPENVFALPKELITTPPLLMSASLMV